MKWLGLAILIGAVLGRIFNGRDDKAWRQATRLLPWNCPKPKGLPPWL